MSLAFSRVPFTGVPPAGAGVTVLFDTTTAFPGEDMTSGMGIHRFYGTIANTNGAASTITLEKTQDAGRPASAAPTWRTVATVAGGAALSTFDFVVEGLKDWRVTYTATVAQPIFEVDQAFIDHRPATT